MIKKSQFFKTAEYRVKNRKWLGYSSNISRRVLAAIENIDGMSQTKLAELLGVKIQYITKIVKGSENLSLKTIAKLSEALGRELIEFPKYEDNISTSEMYTISYSPKIISRDSNKSNSAIAKYLNQKHKVSDILTQCPTNDESVNIYQSFRASSIDINNYEYCN